MKEFYPQSVQTSLSEIKEDAHKRNFLKASMQIVFVISFLLLVFLAIAKAQGF